MSSASIFVLRITCAAPAFARLVLGREREALGRCDLTLESLQRPVAAPLDLRRNAGQRHDRADFFALAGELERRDVALDAVVVRRQRGRARETDGPVLADQAPARRRRRGSHRNDGGNDQSEPDPFRHEQLLDVPVGGDRGVRRRGGRAQVPEKLKS